MKIGLLPASGKPWHAGHDSLLRIAARECDEVRLFVSTSDRKRPGEMPIYGVDMKRIWDEFLEPSLPSNVIVKYGGSPVGHVYAELSTGERDGTEDVFVIYSDIEDIKNYTDASLRKSAPTLMENGQIKLRGVNRSETVNISGTAMRSLIAQGKIDEFIELLPPAVQKNGRKIYNILARGTDDIVPALKKGRRKVAGESILRSYVRSILNS